MTAMDARDTSLQVVITSNDTGAVIWRGPFTDFVATNREAFDSDQFITWATLLLEQQDGRVVLDQGAGGVFVMRRDDAWAKAAKIASPLERPKDFRSALNAIEALERAGIVVTIYDEGSPEPEMVPVPLIVGDTLAAWIVLARMVPEGRMTFQRVEDAR